MNFIQDNLIHIYNEGNNQQTIFFNNKNYLYFLRKVRKFIYPFCDILSYCLLPNQFNFLIYANSYSVSKNSFGRNNLSEGLRILLSSYCKGINIQEKRTGSLFRQNSKIKCLDINSYTALACFVYIHQKPEKSGIVKKLSEWEYSSFKDYAGLRNGTLCRKNLAMELLGIDGDDIKLFSHTAIPKELLKEIF